MKIYKKAILASMVLAAMSLMAAEEKVIQVTTFADEDGENPAQCSLREAVTAASMRQDYGGCSGVQTANGITNVIQLQEGEYQLKRELQPRVALQIQGKAPVDYSKADVLSNEYPAMTAVKTSIRAVGKNRIFNTTELNNPALSLNNLDLHDGYSDNVGGALYIGGSLELNNVSIYNAKAQAGAAIFLNGSSSSLSAVRGNLNDNQAERGSVLAMTCSDNLIYTPRRVAMTHYSVVRNGSANSQSTFAFCGKTSAILSTNTMTENIADPNRGSIIQFSSATPQGKVQLDQASELRLISNTIVKNHAHSTLLYNDVASKTLNFNILAYNGAGQSCRYANGNIADVEHANISFSRNALHLAAGQDQCDIPTEQREAVKQSSIDLSQLPMSTLLSPLPTTDYKAYKQLLTEYTGFMPMYFPLLTSAKNPLIDSGELGCSAVDQRGIPRMNANNSVGDGEHANSCDVGATEVLRLTASNIEAANQSVVELINRYKRNRDQFKSLLDNPNTKPEFLPYYRLQVQEFENNIQYTEQRQMYRTAFVDVFSSNLADEQVLADGSRQVKHLNADNYNVQVQPLGLGKLGPDKKFQGQFDPQLKCKWDPELKQVLMYRLDDKITPYGDSEFCEYRLSLKTDASKFSTAYIMTNFHNIQPIAKNVDLYVQQGSSQLLSVNLLQHTNDDGDGDVSKMNSKPNKPSYYINAHGEDLAIRFSKVPDPVKIVASRTGPCPGEDGKETCYGGDIQLQLKNTLDPFNYKLTYMVYDADAALSNQAVITLNNSGSSSSARSGGGAWGIGALLGLLSLLWLRRRI